LQRGGPATSGWCGGFSGDAAGKLDDTGSGAVGSTGYCGGGDLGTRLGTGLEAAVGHGGEEQRIWSGCRARLVEHGGGAVILKWSGQQE
jgi:hypothetical protein